jgi:hypothetical protein
MHEILDWLRGIDRFGKFSIRNRGYVSVRGRHHGPGQFQRPGAYGFGAVDFRQAEASRYVTPGAFCGWWQVFGWSCRILDQGQRGTTDARGCRDRMQDAAMRSTDSKTLIGQFMGTPARTRMESQHSPGELPDDLLTIVVRGSDKID